MSEEIAVFYHFGVALAIGALLGIQREYAAMENANGRSRTGLFAGVRTFALLALYGCTAAAVADILQSPISFVGLVLPAGGLVVAAYYRTSRRGSVGTTTETSAILSILIGALCYWGKVDLASAIGVATMILLSLKLELRQLVQQITREDVLAVLKFAAITVIILPVLPNRPIGLAPFDVINPYKVWVLVVLISGISFLGYILIKVIGSSKGIGLLGFLGGMVSSTAVTMTFAQRSQKDVMLAKPFALAIAIAWGVMFIRMVVVIAAVNTALVKIVWLPLALTGMAVLLFSIYLYMATQDPNEGNVEFTNPFELVPAIQFGFLYAVILIISNVAQTTFGNTGIYISSVVSGFANMDAITLSMSELSKTGAVSLPIAARAIMLAAISNTAVKGITVLAVGSLPLRKIFWPAIAITLIAGLICTAAFIS